MAEGDAALPGLSIPVTADLAPLGRQGPQIERAAGVAGKSAASAFQKQFGGTAGKKATKEFTDAMERQFKVSQADIREALARGLITPQEAQKQGQEAGRKYKDSLLAEIKRRSAAGDLSDRDFVDLTDRLESVGETGGEQFNEGMMSRMRRLPGLVQGIIAGGVVAVVVAGFRRAAEAIGDFGRLVGETNQIQRGFTSLTTQRGLDPVETLNELRQATNGAVQGVELMRRSNLLLNSELSLSSQQVGELAFLSRRLAESMGRDAAEGFDRFSRGIVKMESELLDELGIMVRVDDATKSWAEANGRSADSLTDAERQLALYTAVVEQARVKVAALGDEELDAGTRVQQAAAFWDDLKRAIVVAVAESPRIESFFNSMGVGASNAADRVQDLADRVGALIDSGSGSLIGAGGGGLAGLIGGAAVGSAAGGVGAIPGALIGGALGTLGGSAAGQILGDFGGPTFDEALQARQEQRAQEQAVVAIRQQTDLLQLEADRLRLRQELADIQREDAQNVEAQRQTMEQLRATEETIARLRTDKEKPKGDGLTDAERQRLLNQAAEAQNLMRTMLADLTASALDDQVEALRQFEAKARETYRKLGQAFPAALEEGIRKLRENAELMSQLESRSREFKGLQDLGATPEHLTQIAQFLRAITAERDALEEGSEAREKYNELVRRTMDLYQRGAKTIGDEADRRVKAEERALEAAERAAAAAVRAREQELRGLRDTARLIEENARAALQLADAFGIVDDNVARTLEGLVQVGTSIARIAGGDMTAIPAAIGSLAQVVSSLFGEDPKAAARIERHREAMRDLEVALLELRDAYLNVSAEQLREDQSFVAGSANFWEFGAAGQGLFKGEQIREMILEHLGMDEASLRRRFAELDERYGLELLTLWEAGDFEGLAEAMAALPSVIQDQIDKLGGFGDDVAGVIARLNFQFDLLGNTNAAERLAAINAGLKELGLTAGEFQDELDELAGLDLSTEEGRRRRDEIIASVAPILASQGFDAGAFTPEQIRALFEEWARAEGAAGGLTGSSATRLSTNITVSQGDEMLSVMWTELYEAQKQTAELRAIASLLSGGGYAIPSTAVPSRALAAGAPMNVLVEFDGFTVDVTGLIVQGGEAGARQAMEAGARAFNEIIGRDLGPALRGQGTGGGNYRIRVNAPGVTR